MKLSHLTKYLYPFCNTIELSSLYKVLSKFLRVILIKMHLIGFASSGQIFAQPFSDRLYKQTSRHCGVCYILEIYLMLQMDVTSSDVVSNTFDIDESPVDFFLAEEGLAEAKATDSFA